MAIKWTPNLAIGIKKIDDQHKVLFERINDLIEACNQGKGKDTVAELITFLKDYVVFHFRDEQQIMLDYKYPEYEAHKKLHDGFVDSLKELNKELEEKGPGLALVLKTNRLVVDWLINHISKVDTQLAAYIKKDGS
ncbi:MAG TPA: hemerythrin family protein [Firmicutes bacterium]|nr:hemerythrin family protein [Bacillota bacterium]